MPRIGNRQTSSVPSRYRVGACYTQQPMLTYVVFVGYLLEMFVDIVKYSCCTCISQVQCSSHGDTTESHDRVFLSVNLVPISLELTLPRPVTSSSSLLHGFPALAIHNSPTFSQVPTQNLILLAQNLIFPTIGYRLPTFLKTFSTADLFRPSL